MVVTTSGTLYFSPKTIAAKSLFIRLINYKTFSKINIKITVEENELLFKIENTNHGTKKEDTDSKVGLKNIKKGLT